MMLQTWILALVQLGSSLFSLAPWHPLAAGFGSKPGLQSSSARSTWSGDLPPDVNDRWRQGASVSACTFALGPPGPPGSALCPAFNAFCSAFRDDLRSHHIRLLKSTPLLSSTKLSNQRTNLMPSKHIDDGNALQTRISKTATIQDALQDNQSNRRIRTTYPTQDDDEDEGNPLRGIKFRTGCVGGAQKASDASYLSAYTATCIVDGIDWVPYVFDTFIKAEFATEPPPDGAPLPIYYSFVGCQIPAHL